MDYNFTYSLTEEEYADYSEFTSWTAPWQKKTKLKFFATYFLSCFVFSTIAAFITSKGNSIIDKIIVPLTVSVIISLIISYLYYINAGHSIRSKVKKLIKKEENINILTEYELTLNEEKIIDKSKKITSTYSWESVVRYAETDKYFFLYTNSVSAVVIPKRLFKNKLEIEEFDKFLTSKIPLSSSFRSIEIGI
jgi:hypothetical protein